ncbi:MULTISPECIES: hypothetical protein [Staphylococcus]|uniref:hypothetical protein n=1 Tax=Staphylococcus TaxID=1279 RepID=UPI0009515990|nr:MULTISPECIES: hypothetical protein [Staphylococcus]OLS09662.1 hypothetical protein AUK68_00065 [Staphylococcus epidermidis]AXV41150.1 hypothetical protein Ssp1_00440 [Staphylococcus sp. M0911]PTI19830.1 hypothetical protein BU082_07680 [Staphylococcus warneri]PTI24072.1 hypothetical protein BU081_06765 [Staphylococcus warneri]RIN00448.1 hypothetical protein BU093_01025 [Staphylococcus warneri]
MEINLEHPVYKVQVSMKLLTSQGVPGTLYLLKDMIYFEADGLLKGSEIKNEFHFNENWIFDYVSRKEGKKFVELYEAIQESNA